MVLAIATLSVIGLVPEARGATITTLERTDRIEPVAGWRLALDGNRLAVAGAERVELYERPASGAPWSLVTTFEPAMLGIAPTNGLGGVSSMALDGDRLVIVNNVVPAPGDVTSFVSIFDREPLTGAWILAARWNAGGSPTATESYVADDSLDLDGDRLAMAVLNCSSFPCTSNLEVWDRSGAGWSRTAALPIAVAAQQVRLDGDRVAARNDDSGLLEVYEPQGPGTAWSLVASVTDTSQTDSVRSGAMDLRGDRIVATDRAGSAVIERDPATGIWSEVAQLPGAAGSRIRLGHDRFVVQDGSFFDDQVVLFRRDAASGQWSVTHTERLAAPLRFVFMDLDGDSVVASVHEVVDDGRVWVDSFEIVERLDGDGDGVADEFDNCVGVANPAQGDVDGDQVGDACDPDDDNDGVDDGVDAFPLDPSESADADGDGVGDNADPDDDNDGLPDSLDPAPFDADADDDGIVDGQDVEHIQAAISAIPDSALRQPAPGHRVAMNTTLNQVESAVAVGDTATALRRLQELRTRVDGCGSEADRSDWVSDCTVQVQIRLLIDTLVANLST